MVTEKLRWCKEDIKTAINSAECILFPLLRLTLNMYITNTFAWIIVRCWTLFECSILHMYEREYDGKIHIGKIGKTPVQ